MILGIDATNIRGGGGVTHLTELLREAEPAVHGFSRVIVWSGQATLGLLPERPWLVKAHVADLDQGLIRRVRWQRRCLSGLARAAGCDVLVVPGGSYTGDFRPVVIMSQTLIPFEWKELRRFGWSWMVLRQLALRVTQAASFRRADGVVFLTEYAKAAVLQVTGPLPGKTAVVPHGVGQEFAGPSRVQEPMSAYSEARPFRLLYVSTINVYKHQWHLVEAVASLRRKGLPVVLDLVGSAYPRAMRRLRQAQARHDPDGRGVTWLGVIPHSEMQGIYQRADAVVFASSCESFGLGVTEAMGAGLPIACARRSAMPEVLGDAGVYFDPEDPADIAQTLERLLASPDLRQELASSAVERSRQFSWWACADATFEFLRDCAAGRGTRNDNTSFSVGEGRR